VQMQLNVEFVWIIGSVEVVETVRKFENTFNTPLRVFGVRSCNSTYREFWGRAKS
jgi:hypothetical protein